MNKSLLFFIPIICGGCLYFPGDGGMGVYGVISGYSGQECRINMYSEKGSWVVDYPLKVIGDKYTSYFTVSPRKSTYQVKLLCGNEVVAKKYVKYPQELDKRVYKFGC